MTILGIIALTARNAAATAYFVDGACATSGTGTSLACGPGGQFRTIAEGVLAMQAGDTLNLRGAHAGFDGTYFEEVYLADKPPAGLVGKALALIATRS